MTMYAAVSDFAGLAGKTEFSVFPRNLWSRKFVQKTQLLKYLILNYQLFNTQSLLQLLNQSILDLLSH